ncbi:hypothetical protein K469DRAFT_131530 [Zopfia rhizophila CBS 207.26]|uniref:Uncharacterized protein n=1 Tax=Zopfia rhizophila CBS 207.26 TaxID=1314779 RepID=A0A6A6ER68_9PEZI|nr:hypothetical protein K469DRAFT_131530 [Zopfia rhizophila CBS 207.26]
MPQEAPVTDYPVEATTSESSSNPMGGRKKPKKLGQGPLQKAPPPELYEDDEDEGAKSDPVPMPRRSGGRRMVPVHQSRIADRPAKVGEKDSSLKIKIELDLEVEVEIYARVKGDVTIGLM